MVTVAREDVRQKFPAGARRAGKWGRIEYIPAAAPEELRQEYRAVPLAIGQRREKGV